MYCTPSGFRRGIAFRPMDSAVAAMMASAMRSPSASCCGTRASGESESQAQTQEQSRTDLATEPQTAASRLPIDIHEENGRFVITASVPGFRKDQISVEVKDGMLTIAATNTVVRQESSGADEATAAANAKKWYRRERRTMNWERSLRLSEGVTGEGTTAELKDGVLTVTIPQPRQVAVPSGIKIDVN